jgi:hypothetical protein
MCDMDRKNSIKEADLIVLYFGTFYMVQGLDLTE